MALDARSDGIFPLVTNVADFNELELLQAYKRQPVIEKRFSQLKTDFEVAPVYLKAVHRIQALLCVYFFVLLLEALLERQLRQAMRSEKIEELPMYPEGALALADHATVDRPLRVRAAACAGTSPPTRRASRYRIESPSTQNPQAHWDIIHQLRPLTCRPPEIQR